MTDIEIIEERQIARADDSRYFDLVMREAAVLSSSKIVPAAYRGREADIVAAGLAGRAFGWDVMAAMRNFHVIEGSASMKPEAMLGLVRQAGHSVIITSTDGSASAVGKRIDSGDEHTATFTLQDAEDAGLAGKKNWKQYQESMLQWRAVSKLCRALFSDVVLGAGYVPEELGAQVGSEGDIITMVSASKAKHTVLDAANGDKELAIEAWGNRGSSAITEDELHNIISSLLDRSTPISNNELTATESEEDSE